MKCQDCQIYAESAGMQDAQNGLSLFCENVVTEWIIEGKTFYSSISSCISSRSYMSG